MKEFDSTPVCPFQIGIFYDPLIPWRRKLNISIVKSACWQQLQHCAVPQPRFGWTSPKEEYLQDCRGEGISSWMHLISWQAMIPQTQDPRHHVDSVVKLGAVGLLSLLPTLEVFLQPSSIQGPSYHPQHPTATLLPAASPKNLQPFAIPQQSAHPLLELILFSSHSRHSFKETLPTLKNTWKKSPGARSELIFAVWRVPLCCRMSRGRSSVCLGSPYVLQYRGWEQSSWLSNHQRVEVRS